MKTDQENGIQINDYTPRVSYVIDYDFDLLRAHARERSIWAVRTQCVQEIIVTAMVIVLGGIMGWAVMR